MKKEYKSVKKQSKEVLKKKEAELILKQLNPKDIVVLLDEKGKEMSSEQFSVWLEKKQMSGGHIFWEFLFICVSPWHNKNNLCEINCMHFYKTFLLGMVWYNALIMKSRERIHIFHP